MHHLNKKQILFVCFLFALGACKKNDSAPLENKIDVVGTWHLFSYNSEQNGNTAPVYTATDYPCLTDNKLLINSDGTVKGKYIGNDTCYVLHTSTSSISIGMAGDSTSGTWSQSGNTIYMNFLNKIYTSQISITNGALQIIQKDSVPYMNTIITTIHKK